MNKVYGKAYFTEHAVAVKANKNNNTDFLFFLLDKMNLRQYSGQSAQPGLAVNKLIELITLVPNCSEQKLIGIFFNKLDNLITLHQRKLDHLKDKKKGLLQKMFPKKGELVPELRFPEFTDPWEQRKLGDLGEIITGSTPKTNDLSNYKGNYLFVSPVDIQGNRYVEKTITTLSQKGFNSGRQIRKGASLFVSIGSTIGKVAQTAEDSTSNQQINALVSNSNNDDDFIFTLLETQSGKIKAIASNQAVPIVNKTTFGETEVLVPFDIAEQIQIGSYFKKIDNLITLHQRKLDHLKEQKKALLQQMFI